MLKVDNTILVIIDIQTRLAALMQEREEMIRNQRRMIRGAQILEIPILWNEQYPEGLGPTIPELKDLLTEMQPLAKRTFSCCGNEGFIEQLKSFKRKQVLLIGIESHVCVYQSAADLIEAGFEVQAVTDAISSRTEANRQIGFERMRDLGVTLTSTETALFELLRVAQGPQFKEISKLVK
jgi:hypothetical protein